MPRTILIVEDDENVSELLAFIFRREGFEATLLRDGRAAVDHVAAHGPPDAVILDVLLPCRDGYAVAGAIRADARWNGVPIVMLTGNATGRDRERALAAGANAFLGKPFRPAALVEQVRGLLQAAVAA